MLFESTEAGWEEKPRSRQVLKTELASGAGSKTNATGRHKEDAMRMTRLVLFAMLLAVPFAVTAKAQEMVGVGPEVVAPPMAYGPPVCEWGYYAYYPYACAPYGYYGPEWFYGGLFIGAGPWYHRGWYGRGGYGRGGYGRGEYAYGGRGGYGNRGGYGGRGEYPGRGRGPIATPRSGGGYRGGYGGQAPRGFSGGNRGGYGGAPRGGFGGGHSGGGFGGGGHAGGGFGGGGHSGGGGHGGGHR